MEAHLTLIEAVTFFADFDNCLKFMTELRWPDGVVRCPRCDSDHVTFLDKARRWKCYGKHESPTFTLKTGTVFEDSPIPIEKWVVAVWQIVNCKNGISSYELHRALGVTQKSAWFMLHRVRLAMQDDQSGGMLNGEVEVDETFIGGKARNMHKSVRARKIAAVAGSDGKEIVIGMVERGGRVRTVHVSKRSKPVLQRNIRQHIEADSAIFTDALKSYDGLSEFRHEVVDHAVEYVNGNVHTNTMENFWSLLKRGLKGTYISVEPFHLFRYLDEQAFRYNTRKGPDGEIITDYQRFILAMYQIVGKRLTYKQLTGKSAEA